MVFYCFYHEDHGFSVNVPIIQVCDMGNSWDNPWKSKEEHARCGKNMKNPRKSLGKTWRIHANQETENKKVEKIILPII